MKLLFKQRFFSWFDSYDIYDEAAAFCRASFRPVHRRAREHGHAVALSEVPDA